MHQKGTHADGAKTDDAVERMNGDAQAVFLFDADNNGFTFFEEVGLLRGDVECVKVLLH